MFGIRKSSLSKSFKAMIVGRVKRGMKRMYVPGYRKKGAGLMKNPGKAYKRTTLEGLTLGKFKTMVKNKKKVEPITEIENPAIPNTRVSFDNHQTDQPALTFFNNSTFWTVLCLIIFFPVGVGLMWYYKKSWKKWIKIPISVLAGILTISILGTSNSTSGNPVSNNSGIVAKQESPIKKESEVEKEKSEELKKAEEKAKADADKKAAEEAAKKAEEDKKAAEAEVEATKKIEADKAAAEEKVRQEEAKRVAESNTNNQSGSNSNTAPAAPKEHYTSCKEMRKVHPNGAKKGDAWYNPALDRDGDGYACEKK